MWLPWLPTLLLLQEVVLGGGAPNEEGNIVYEQMRTLAGIYKVGK